MQVSFKGLDEIRAKTAQVQAGAVKQLLNFVSAVAYSKVRQYPPYQYASRKDAYGMQAGGEGWFSDKQRRYVMAKIASGEITPGVPNRTDATANAWQTTVTESYSMLYNESQGAKYTMGDATQARQPALAGWSKLQAWWVENKPAVMTDANKMFDNWVKSIFK